MDHVLNNQISDADAAKIITQILLALNYCHGKGVYHRDVKPENIIINREGKLKLIDFGSAVQEPATEVGIEGTMMYMAPEVLLNRPYSASSDIWSVGIIVYILSVGAFPFPYEDTDLMCSKIKTANIDQN